MLMRIAASLAVMALIPAPASAAPARRVIVKVVQAKPPAPLPPTAKPLPPAIPFHEIERVAITTELGVITLDLEGKKAPVSTGNFLRYVDSKRFDGMTFYRSMHLPWGDPPNGLVQAGVRGDPRKVLPPVAHEPTSQTGVLHKAGTISLARLAPGTATGDFSIMLSDLEALDADPKSGDPEIQAGYAAFGHVVDGMDVVRKIWDSPRDPEAGEGPLKGQMLATPVKVLSVRRVPAMAPTITRP
jgi:peptidyl-prolyl cis-trans isomerase A (cyclophilin A)